MTALDRFRAWVGEQEARGLARWQIAALVGISESVLSRLLRGSRGASGSVACKIEAATATWSRGKIRAAEWFLGAAEAA